MSELLPDRGYEGNYIGKESMEALNGGSDDERMGENRGRGTKENSVDQGETGR